MRTPAIAKAKASLPEFWARAAAPQPGDSDFCVKVPVRDGTETEFFWINELERSNGTVHGAINNDPMTVKTVTLGQVIAVPESEVIDWLYMRGGKLYGYYPVRPLRSRMPAEEARKVRAMLAEP